MDSVISTRFTQKLRKETQIDKSSSIVFFYQSTEREAPAVVDNIINIGK
jgi:hypothetical protein